jgi:dienelactone hydrolase
LEFVETGRLMDDNNAMEQRVSSMRGRLLRWVDRGVILFAASRMPKPGRREPRLSEAAELLRRPDYFHESVAPASLEFVNDHAFEFSSPVQTPYPENNRARGRFYRCAGEWRDKPAVILLHGWNDATTYYARHPLAARLLNRAGVNALIPALPYHFERKPTVRGAIHNIISEDILRTVEAVRQAVADTRALAGWAREQGCPGVGVWGVSMGGLIGGLALCHDARLSFGILMTPLARMDRLIGEIEFVASVRHAVNGQNVDFTPLNLVSHKPMVSLENLLLVEAQYDAFIPRDTIEDLWEHWGKPEIWRLPHGHISALGSFGLIRRSVKWIESVVRAALFETNRLPSR